MEDYLVDEFLESLRLKGFRQVTIDEYKWNLHEFLDYLVSIPLYSFFAATHENATAYYIAVKEKMFASRTVWKKQFAAYAFYQWLKESGSLLVNPAPYPVTPTAQALPRRVPGRDTLAYTYEKLSESTELWEQRDYAIIDLAYSCGLRRCELHALDISDVNSTEGTLRIYGKGGKERIVPIGPKALKDLFHYIYHVRPRFIKESTTPALFLSWQRGGTRMNARSINKAFVRLRNKYGLPDTLAPHALRHAFATELVRAGAPVQDVSEMLGHTKLETTQVYTRLTVTDLKARHKQCHPRG